MKIPIFTTQLEKSRESVDEANIRSAYAEIMAAALTEDTAATTNSTAYTLTMSKNADGTMKGVAVVTMKQSKDGWQNTAVKEIGGEDISGLSPSAGGTCTITYDGSATSAADELTIAFAAKQGA